MPWDYFENYIKKGSLSNHACKDCFQKPFLIFCKALNIVQKANKCMDAYYFAEHEWN